MSLPPKRPRPPGEIRGCYCFLSCCASCGPGAAPGQRTEHVPERQDEAECRRLSPQSFGGGVNNFDKYSISLIAKPQASALKKENPKPNWLTFNCGFLCILA
jgi:hypothetical protein